MLGTVGGTLEELRGYFGYTLGQTVDKFKYRERGAYFQNLLGELARIKSYWNPSIQIISEFLEILSEFCPNSELSLEFLRISIQTCI